MDFEDDIQEDFTSPDFILRDLNITKECFSDPHNGLQARRDISEIVAYQIIFYTYLALKSFEITRSNPSILLFGTGYIGTRVANELIKSGCSAFLKIYCRGDTDAKLWRSRGIRSSNMLRKLYTSGGPDIVIMCSPAASYTAMSRQLEKITTRSLFFIFSTLGLRRRRVFMTLKCPGVLRTYQEPDFVSKRIRATKRSEKSDIAIKLIENLNNAEKHSPEEFEDFLDEDEETLDEIDEGGTEDEKSPNSKSYRRLDTEFLIQGAKDLQLSEEDLAMSPIETAAEFVARRCIDIRNLIYVVENYYAIRGIPYYMARYAALKAIVGWEDLEYPQYFSQIGWDPVIRKLVSEEEEAEVFEEENIDKLSALIQSMHESVVGIFQQQLSKHIRVVDLPKVGNVESKLEELAESLKVENDSMEQQLAVNLPNYFNGVNAPPHNKKSKAKRKISPPTIWASVRDGAGYSMHQKKHIISIFDQDRSFQGASRPAFEYLSRLKPIRVDEEEESIISAMDRILDFGAVSTALEEGELVNDGDLSAAAARSAAVMNGLRGHIMDLNAELGILTSDA